MKTRMLSESRTTAEILKEVRTPTMGPIERGKALKVKLAQPKVTTTPTIVATAPKVREVVNFGQHAKLVQKPVAEQKDWEHRAYLRDWFNEKPNENMITHTTSHTSNEVYSVAIETMQKLYLIRNPVSPMFKAKDLVVALKIYGPAISDVVRNAMQKLAKEGKVKVHKESIGRAVRYTFELLELPQVVKQPQA